MNESNRHSTDHLILQMKNDFETRGFSSRWKNSFWINLSVIFIAILLLTFFSHLLLPEYIYLPENLFQPYYWSETIIWVFLIISMMRISYLSAHAEPAPRHLKTLIGGAGLCMLVLWAFKFNAEHMTFSKFTTGLNEETSLIRGPCGFFIFTTGMMSTLLLARVFQKAAVVHTKSTAIALSLSVGSMASLCMHLVCPHESPIHVFIWHILPLILCTFFVFRWSIKLFQWSVT